ncbi:transcription factor Adf-1-like [Carassius gibelio]|uniref:transcription factor Adf-1-like n=1 Tax=Carassius gibelio TaxID=101364 RepID=UPI002278643A|nr:transcription factor Adf-1-like [Carassius gibelio]
MAFIKDEIQDMKIEETFRVKKEDPEEQTVQRGFQMNRRIKMESEDMKTEEVLRVKQEDDEEQTDDKSSIKTTISKRTFIVPKDMAVWNEASEDALISMIRERPALYDITEKSYSSRVEKAEMWREIENKLVISEKELKKRWDSLRTQYLRYKKQGPSGSSGCQKTGRQQWILNRLQFLQPHMKRNERTSNLTFRESLADSDSCSPSNGTNSETWTVTHEEPSFIEVELRPSTPLPESTICENESTAESTAIRKKPNTPKPPGKRRKMQDESFSKESTYLMRTIGKTLEKLASQENTNDAISAFCKNLEHRMRSLPAHVLPHFQHEVDDCIFKYSVGHNHSLEASVHQYTHL